MMKTLLLLLVSALGIQLFAPAQSTPTATNQIEDKWWSEAKERGLQVAQLKQARADANATVSKRMQEQVRQAAGKGTGKSLAVIQDEVKQQAAPELAVIQRRYDPLIATSRQQFLTFLHERTASDANIYAATSNLQPEILYKEKAAYSEAARQNRVQGAVLLSVIFSADGTIGNLRVIRGLPDGLSEEALAAARELVFLPAQKNGQPVSVRMMIEYSFALI